MTPGEQFRNAIRSVGLVPPEVIEPDKFHRFPGNGKEARNRAAWCKQFADGNGGVFGDFSSGLVETWQARRDKPTSAAERAAFARQVNEARRAAEAERAARQAEAAEKAVRIWNGSRPVADHPYLRTKSVPAYGLHQYGNALVVPMCDTSGRLHSLQFITSGGEKRFLPGGAVTGHYHGIGRFESVILVAEGFATGATIHEATGYTVAVAFNAGNLEPVAKTLREKFPELPLILCADDDIGTEGNPGLTKATEAARAVGGVVAIPDFGVDRPDGATDFNDMAATRGLEAVERVIASAMATTTENQSGDKIASEGDSGGLNDADTTATPASDVTGVTGVQGNSGAGFRVTPGDDQGVTAVTPETTCPIPDEAGRPVYCVFEDWQEHGGRKYQPGVWHFGIKPGKGDAASTLTDTRVCSPLYVDAVTFDGQDNNFGRLLRFRNSLGRWREWAMPMELLRAGGDELRGELLAMGVEIDPSAKTLLANYLQAKPPKRRMRCALQVGWCEDSFVLPDAVIGPKASGVIFQSGERGYDEHTKAGTLIGWREGIAARAVGNPLLTLALSASFAGPMLARCNAEGGGLHFVGDSSTGKTTLIEAACSIWGGPNFRRSWRATANGMEGAAALFNDCLLALDEISECDPREVGAIVYALGNGRGKQRASRSGSARGVTRWRCVVLSSGERTIATAMQEGGYRAKAGQAVRLLDMPTARAFGTWDGLHGATGAAAFSDAIKRAAITHHGHAGRAFLEKLTRDERDFCAFLERIKALPEFTTDAREGQDKRAAARFALLALAGEVATEYGLTGWPEGAAISAAAESFKAWQGIRGRGNDERRQIHEKVSGFLERHGDARFSGADSNKDNAIRDRAGWWREIEEGRIYLFTADGMREAVKGFDFNRALDALQETGALPGSGTDGKRSKVERIGRRLVRVYPIIADKLGAGHGT